MTTIKDEYREWLTQLEFDMFITFNYGCKIPIELAEKTLSVWDAKYSTRLIRGRNPLHRKNRNKRNLFIAYPEYGFKEGVLHYHALIKFSAAMQQKRSLFFLEGDSIWDQVTRKIAGKPGHIHKGKKPLTETPFERSSAAGYTIKDFNEDYLINLQFMS